MILDFRGVLRNTYQSSINYFLYIYTQEPFGFVLDAHALSVVSPEKLDTFLNISTEIIVSPEIMMSSSEDDVCKLIDSILNRNQHSLLPVRFPEHSSIKNLVLYFKKDSTIDDLFVSNLNNLPHVENLTIKMDSAANFEILASTELKCSRVTIESYSSFLYTKKGFETLNSLGVSDLIVYFDDEVEYPTGDGMEKAIEKIQVLSDQYKIAFHVEVVDKFVVGSMVRNADTYSDEDYDLE